MFKLNPATGQALTQTQPTQTQTQPQPTQPQPTQPQTQTQPTQPQTTQTQPLKSNYAFPISTFYGSLGNYTPPVIS
jgi:hypothetical protein